MKRIFLFLLLLVFFIFPVKALAHLQGQQPFFTINDVYTPLYPIPTTSLSDFILPQDIAPKTYLINEPLQFKIDTQKLPMISAEALKNMIFTWDFGDGMLYEGLQTEHSYVTMGSYILTIKADSGNGDTPVLLQSVLLHILPNSTYILPQAVIAISGKTVKDPLTDTLSYALSDSLSFDASNSKSSSSDIVSYLWDFGDMKSSNQKKEEHIYNDDLRIIFPVLRIKDKNGFISDAFVQVNNTLYDTGTKTAEKNVDEKKKWRELVTDNAFIILCVGGVIVFFLVKRRTKNTKL